MPAFQLLRHDPFHNHLQYKCQILWTGTTARPGRLDSQKIRTTLSMQRLTRKGSSVYVHVWGDNAITKEQDHWDSGKPRRQQILFCDIQIKVVISRRQIYVYHTDLLPLKI